MRVKGLGLRLVRFRGEGKLGLGGRVKGFRVRFRGRVKG